MPPYPPNSMQSVPVEPVRAPRSVSQRLINPTPIAQQPMAQPVMEEPMQLPVGPQAAAIPPPPQAGSAGAAISAAPRAATGNPMKDFLTNIAGGLSTMRYSPTDPAASFAAALGSSLNSGQGRQAQQQELERLQAKEAYDRSMQEREFELKEAKDKRESERNKALNQLTAAQTKKAEAEAAETVEQQTGYSATAKERTNARIQAWKEIEGIYVDDIEDLNKSGELDELLKQRTTEILRGNVAQAAQNSAAATQASQPPQQSPQTPVQPKSFQWVPVN